MDKNEVIHNFKLKTKKEQQLDEYNIMGKVPLVDPELA